MCVCRLISMTLHKPSSSADAWFAYVPVLLSGCVRSTETLCCHGSGLVYLPEVTESHEGNAAATRPLLTVRCKVSAGQRGGGADSHRTTRGLLYNTGIQTHLNTVFTSPSTWRRSYGDLPSTPPSTKPRSTIDGQCKAPEYYMLLTNGLPP